MESIIRKLRSEIIQLKKEYNELSKSSQLAEDFYENHNENSCEDLIEYNRETIVKNNELKLKIRYEQNSHRISAEFLCSLYYDDLINEYKYNKLYPDERNSMNSLSMLGEHLCSDKVTTEVYILKHEDKQMAIDRHEHEEKMKEMRAEKSRERRRTMNSTFSTKERANVPVETDEEDETIILALTPEIIAKAKKGELNEKK